MHKRDGGIIREGFNEDVDKFRSARTDGKKWLTELEARERERTGIKSLKIKYNRVFGYALEVTNTFRSWYRRTISANKRLRMLSVILQRS